MLFKLLTIFILLYYYAKAVQVCPKRSSSDPDLTCPVQCCISHFGENNGYYCCGEVRDRFTTAVTGFQIDYTWLIIGLIFSIIASILLSLLCCFLCNICWFRRRRNPANYEDVNDRSGFYPLCCGFGIPLGTVVFSTHPPQFNDAHYGDSLNSMNSHRNRVHFDEDGRPIKSVLKNGHVQDSQIH